MDAADEVCFLLALESSLFFRAQKASTKYDSHYNLHLQRSDTDTTLFIPLVQDMHTVHHDLEERGLVSFLR